MDRLMTLEEVATEIRRSEHTLRYWRARGEGPPAFKIGRRVVYREADVVAWLEAQRELAAS